MSVFTSLVFMRPPCILMVNGDPGKDVYDGCSGIIAHLLIVHAYGCNEDCLSGSMLGSPLVLFMYMILGHGLLCRMVSELVRVVLK